MAKISRLQKDYIKAYEVTKTKTNVPALIGLTEMSYEEKENIVEYKSDISNIEYSDKINTCFKHMISTFFKIDNASPIYDNFKDIYSKFYLDNTDDDTNDYKDETMIKLNKIYGFINNLGSQDLMGTELLSLIRREINDVDEPLEDETFDKMFLKLRCQADVIRTAEVEEKMDMVSGFLANVGIMEAHLFKEKLFYDDYRKSVTGLTNYLFGMAGIPEIHIKPIELDSYYEHVNNASETLNCNELSTFYKEKICDSIEHAFILPMKEAIKYYTDTTIKEEVGDLDNPIHTLKQNKYK
jgi:hypothetical protein